MTDAIVAAFSGPGAGFMYAITAVLAFALAIAVERAALFWGVWRARPEQVLDALRAGQVETAVQDAIKAREDRERLSFEAQAYANDVVPRARGEAVRRQQDAEGYRARVVADAQGEAARFELLLAEYKKAPEVTRRRLYLEAMEEIYSSSNKVLVDSDSGNNMLYLPVDKILEQRRNAGATPALRDSAPPVAVKPAAPVPPRDPADLRTRGAR